MFTLIKNQEKNEDRNFNAIPFTYYGRGSLAKWYVSPGDIVKPGDILADIETDKALMEYESIEEGTILELVVKEGTRI